MTNPPAIQLPMLALTPAEAFLKIQQKEKINGRKTAAELNTKELVQIIANLLRNPAVLTTIPLLPTPEKMLQTVTATASSNLTANTARI